MRRKLTGAALAASVLVLAAGRSAGAQTLATDDAVLRAIWHEATARSHIEGLAQALLDSLGPRLTGSPGIDRAHDWALRTYESWGIPARNEHYGTWLGWDRGITHIDLVAPRVRTLEGRMLAWSPGTDGPVEGEPIILADVASPREFQAWLPRVRGRFVLISMPQPTCRPDEHWERHALPEAFERTRVQRGAAEALWNRRVRNTGLSTRELPRRLEEAGALGVITSDWPGGWGVTRVFRAWARRAMPSLELSCEDYGLVYRLTERDQGPRLRVNAEARYLGDVPVMNTVAEIRGTEVPDEYVMLSAHFDSWDAASGATDNGTGTVLMMEVMRVLKEVYPNPRRTILVGHWSGEEQGLNGSRAFAEDNPHVVAGLQALFNQDNGTGRVVQISGEGLVDAGAHLARWLARVPQEVARHVELDLPGTPSTGGTDHASFVCATAPAFNLRAHHWEYNPYTWHTTRDTFDKLVFHDLRNNVVLAASLAYLASEDPERVPRTRRQVMPLSASTGEPTEWPECRSPHRSVGESDRM